MSELKLFYIDLHCEDYDPNLKSDSFLIIGESREEVYEFYREKFNEDGNFDSFSRSLYVDETSWVRLYYERAIGYEPKIHLENGTIPNYGFKLHWVHIIKSISNGFQTTKLLRTAENESTAEEIIKYQAHVYPDKDDIKKGKVTFETCLVSKAKHYKEDKEYPIYIDDLPDDYYGF